MRIRRPTQPIVIETPVGPDFGTAEFRIDAPIRITVIQDPGQAGFEAAKETKAKIEAYLKPLNVRSQQYLFEPRPIDDSIGN